MAYHVEDVQLALFPLEPVKKLGHVFGSGIRVEVVDDEVDVIVKKRAKLLLENGALDHEVVNFELDFRAQHRLEAVEHLFVQALGFRALQHEAISNFLQALNEIEELFVLQQQLFAEALDPRGQVDAQAVDERVQLPKTGGLVVAEIASKLFEGRILMLRQLLVEEFVEGAHLVDVLLVLEEAKGAKFLQAIVVCAKKLQGLV